MRCSPPLISGRTRKVRASKPRHRINKDDAAQFPGHCIAMDTIHYFVNRTRYYLFTAIDHYSRFAVAITCQCAHSKNAATFAKLVHTVFLGTIRQVLTDNGSEFQGDFDAYLQQHNIKHCYTYPRCPKMNAVDERFNCIIQEESVAYHEDILVKDLTLFNEVLFEYLGRYNFRRPYQGLAYKTPAQQPTSFCTNLSNMSWHCTFWGKILVGYYSGAELKHLSDNTALSTCSDPLPQPKSSFTRLKDNMLCVSKLHVVEAIKQNIPKNSEILSIGDKGRWPGNESELLKETLSLSVDEVSYSPETSWNLCPAGMRGAQGTLYYLRRLKRKNGTMRFFP